MTPTTPATYRDIERLEEADSKIWSSLGKRAYKEDVDRAIEKLDEEKADKDVVNRIESGINKRLDRLTWVGASIAIGLIGTGAGLIGNLVLH